MRVALKVGSLEAAASKGVQGDARPLTLALALDPAP